MSEPFKALKVVLDLATYLNTQAAVLLGFKVAVLGGRRREIVEVDSALAKSVVTAGGVRGPDRRRRRGEQGEVEGRSV
jgi:hypothetical protein